MALGPYAGRTVVVTGARTGLGRAIAGHFLGSGAHVVGLSRGAGTLAHERYLHLQVDVGDDAAVRKTFSEIGRRLGAVHVLVNNAAVLTSMHALLMPGARAEEMVRTNLLGTLYASREAAKLMRKAKWGRIVNIGSMAVPLEPAGDSVYAATKAGVVTLAGVLARELAGFAITVNTLGVTAIATDMLAKLPKDRIDAVVAGLPLPRYATEDDIFNVLDFFASQRSGYVTAQTLYLGGIH